MYSDGNERAGRSLYDLDQYFALSTLPMLLKAF